MILIQIKTALVLGIHYLNTKNNFQIFKTHKFSKTTALIEYLK